MNKSYLRDTSTGKVYAFDGYKEADDRWQRVDKVDYDYQQLKSKVYELEKELRALRLRIEKLEKE